MTTPPTPTGLSILTSPNADTVLGTLGITQAVALDGGNAGGFDEVTINGGVATGAGDFVYNGGNASGRGPATPVVGSINGGKA